MTFFCILNMFFATQLSYCLVVLSNLQFQKYKPNELANIFERKKEILETY